MEKTESRGQWGISQDDFGRLFYNTNSSGLRGDYYANSSLTPPIALIRYNEIIDFDWGGGSPDHTLGNDQFSIRWTGQVEAEYTETYTFQHLS